MGSVVKHMKQSKSPLVLLSLHSVLYTHQVSEWGWGKDTFSPSSPASCLSSGRPVILKAKAPFLAKAFRQPQKGRPSSVLPPALVAAPPFL